MGPDSTNIYLNINGVTLPHPCLDLFDRIGCVTVEYFKV